MKATLACLGLLVAVGIAAPAAHAQYYPYQTYPPRVAPDMCGPGYYCTNGCTWYGPSYCVYPPFAPFNGMLPKPPPTGIGGGGGDGGPGNVAFPVNPWTRSPRDFFMWNEAQQERITRATRPPFVP